MDTLKTHNSRKKTNVLLLWKRGEDESFLGNTDVQIFKDGVVQILNPATKEKLTTYISNVVIIEGGADRPTSKFA